MIGEFDKTDELTPRRGPTLFLLHRELCEGLLSPIELLNSVLHFVAVLHQKIELSGRDRRFLDICVRHVGRCS